MSPKAPPLPPELALMMRDERMPLGSERPKSKASEGKMSPGARKTPTRKTPSKTPPKTPPAKSTTPSGQRKTPSGQRTPTLPAFKDGETKTEPKETTDGQQSPQEGRISRGSKGSRGRLSRGSRKTPVQDIDVEGENRPFSQAHEEPVTQVEIETEPGANQNQSNLADQNTTDQNVKDDEKEVETNKDKKDDEGPHYM